MLARLFVIGLIVLSAWDGARAGSDRRRRFPDLFGLDESNKKSRRQRQL
jgi:hypothetical protein